MNTVYLYLITHGYVEGSIFVCIMIGGIGLCCFLHMISYIFGKSNYEKGSKLLALWLFLSFIYIGILYLGLHGIEVEKNMICDTVLKDNTLGISSDNCNYDKGILIISFPYSEKQSYSLLKNKFEERNRFDYVVFNFFEQELAKSNPLYFAERNKQKILDVCLIKKQRIDKLKD